MKYSNIRLFAGAVFLLFLSTAFQVQADAFSIEKAEWDVDNRLLYIKGYGEPNATVQIFVEGTDYLVASTIVYRREVWRLWISNPPLVPCSIRAESQGASANQRVEYAPTECADSSDLGDSSSSNEPPAISGLADSTATVGINYTFQPSASDPDGDALTFSILNRPAWTSFNTATGTLTGTPGASDAGVYSNITISVSDGTVSTALDPFSITVTDIVEDPVQDLLPGPPTLVSAQLSGTSAILTWTQDNAIPEGGYDIVIDNVDTNTLYRTTLLTATIPDIDTAVPHCFAIQARYTDTGQFLLSNQLCTDAVETVNTAPTISGSPTTSVLVGNSYSFTPSASDADGNALTFSILNRPAWASFNTATGTLTGTPGAGDTGVYNNITISVSDGTDSTALDPFSITVTDIVEDPVQDLLPGPPTLVSAQLSGTSAILTWTQDNAVPEGGYDIVIDNVDTNTLYRTTLLTATIPDIDTATPHCFAIQARYTDTSQFLLSNQLCIDAAVSTNSVNLTWTIPTTRTDGSPLSLSEIAGYRIYMGSSSDNLQMITDLNDGLATSYSVPNLSAGTFYFAITTYDMDDLESGFSNIAVKSVM